MAWEILTTEDVLSEFTMSEAASIRTLQGSGSGSGFPFLNIDKIVIRVIDEVRGYIEAGEYELDVDPRKIPLTLFNDAIAVARWRLLIATPSFRQLQTEERRLAYQDALKKLGLIAAQEFAIEPPVPPVLTLAGTWNAENKLIMRTHPVPVPSVQGTTLPDDYANPEAPPDRSPAP
jgi:hypothetical protein